MERIIECVPNFSEGRNMEVINSIVASIEKAGGVKVLDVDPGEATNRTVVTFVGSPEAVLEAAFQGVKRAGELIDMRQHHGAHPRSGATDVLPLIPISGITLEECAELARKLAERIYNELEIPCYCYEAAAQRPERKNLAVCRAGEYEALPEKMGDPQRQPDFGPGEYTERTAQAGATNVGARDFLIAVNYNLNTTSTRRANAIAYDVRESGILGQIEFTYDVPMGLKVRGNVNLLSAMLMNLAKNTANYSCGTTCTLEYLGQTADDFYKFCFYDDGVGVPEESLEHIFDRFYRIDVGRSRKTGGTGLGLSIVYSTISALGGEIHASNRHDAGLQITFTLPIWTGR